MGSIAKVAYCILDFFLVLPSMPKNISNGVINQSI